MPNKWYSKNTTSGIVDSNVKINNKLSRVISKLFLITAFFINTKLFIL